MRLTEDEQTLIKHTIASAFGNDACIWLFGSRIDDNKRGGDVDLYVESAITDTYSARLQALHALENALPYPVDLVVNEPGRDLPVYRIARTRGVRL
jgi:predicted nucleotidyltransferase